MIEVESDIENLGDWERAIEGQLASDHRFFQPIHLSCTIREGQLLVLVHCPEATQPNSQALFHRIRGIIARDRPSQLEGLQLYLIIHGQRILPEGKETSALVRLSQTLTQNLAQTLSLSVPSRKNLPRRFLVTAQTLQAQARRTLRYLRDRPLPGVAIAAGLIVTAIGLSAITRPCVMGRCPVLSESAQLVSEAERILTQATTLPDLKLAQAQLTQAIRQLQAISPWSGYYNQALLSLGDYQQTAHQLTQAIAALTLGEQAQTLAQKPALSPIETQRLQQLWQRAINPLQSIPTHSPLSTLAQAKRQDYQARLNQISQKVRQQETAIATLHRAEEAATLAQKRQETASSLQDWQVVTATWNTVLKLLRQVPAGSSSGEAARQAIHRYLPLWVQANKRQQLEQAAQLRYQQAIQSAQAAQAEQRKQHSQQAVLYWQQAIAHLTAIAPQSLQASAAQNLLPTYRLALAQAQAQRDRQVELQAIGLELNQICQTPEKICDYSLGDNPIRLTLTAAYLAQVWNNSLAAQAQANVPTQMAILNQVSRLEQNLQLLSQKTGLAIAVYNPQGTLIARYEVR